MHLYQSSYFSDNFGLHSNILGWIEEEILMKSSKLTGLAIINIHQNIEVDIENKEIDFFL